MLIHVSLTQLSRGWLVSGEVDNREIGQLLRESCAVLRERIQGLHRFSCSKFGT